MEQIVDIMIKDIGAVTRIRNSYCSDSNKSMLRLKSLEDSEDFGVSIFDRINNQNNFYVW